MQSHFIVSIVFASIGAILFAAKAIVVKFSYQYGATADVILTLRMVFSLPIFWLAVWWSQRHSALRSLICWMTAADMSLLNTFVNPLS